MIIKASKLTRRLVCSAFLATLAVAAQSGSAFAEQFKVGLVLDKGGKDDKSFNSAAFLGATKAEKEFKIQLKVVEATDDNAFEPLLRAFVQKKFDLIIAVGFAQAEALTKISKAYPNVKFAIVDSEVKAANVRSMLFEEHEGSFLVGAIAGLKTKTNKLGFIGGMDIPLIRRFQMGYEAGAKHVNPKAQVISNYVGVTGDAWNNPPKGKELALSQYNAGADIVFGAAGASGRGLFDAAEEKKLFAIGVDSNQNWIKPGLVLTSMLKRVDVAVYNACRDAQSGKFTGGLQRFGLSNEGVDFALDANNEKLLDKATLEKVRALKADIISGKVKVPDYYKKAAK